MAIESNDPRIECLRMAVEKHFGKRMKVHSDFIALMDDIDRASRQHISETTLERVWNYSTRGYSTVSLRTLDLLALYIGATDWMNFCECLKKNSEVESEFFDCDMISSSELEVGDRLQFSWMPDRICSVRYLGDNRFIAEECRNSTIRPGDSFSCLTFKLNEPLVMDNFTTNSPSISMKERSYMVGTKNGLTSLKRL